MKKIVLILAALIFFSPTMHAQLKEAQQLAIDIEKLAQFKSLLKQMYEAYSLISNGYEKVKNVTSGNYSLHEAFVDGLLLVNPNLRNYKRVGDIITYQGYLLSEYKKAFSTFKQSGRFSPKEIIYVSGVYSNLFNESLQNLDELTLVLTKSDLRMSDDERLQAIDRLFDDMSRKLQFLRNFNKRTAAVMQQRAQQTQDQQTLQQLYNVTP